jgi:purine-nucleoside phosphorylase
MAIEQNIKESLDLIRSKCTISPNIGLVLGSGLGDFAESLSDKVTIPTSMIPHYPVSTVSGHQGNLVFGYINKIPLLVIQGRTHYYEGYHISEVSYVVRLMANLGISLLFVTNAAGGVNRYFRPGDLMLIRDHINFLFRNPLIGEVIGSESRWTDMFNAYDNEYSDIIEKIALDLNTPLKNGILFSSTGPTYETKAEIDMAHKFGADAVSMSTVPEVLVARANNIRTVGISCITNMATGLSNSKLSHEEVTDIANQVKLKFQKLLYKSIEVLGKMITDNL